MALFEIQNLTYFYPESSLPALEGVDLSVFEGEFLLMVGDSGSGKTTLAKFLAGLLLDFYGGKIGGRAEYRGIDIVGDRRRVPRGEIAMVFQDPEKQLMMTEVEGEIAFGLENLGFTREEMGRRIAEVMAFMGLTAVKDVPTFELSGGIKQKLVISSVLAMQPRVLIFDEPTSQLDPPSAEEILNLIKRINEELGITVILIEQRLERCFHLADRVLLMDGGKALFCGTPREMIKDCPKERFALIPPVCRFFCQLGFSPVPLTVKEGRRVLKEKLGKRSLPADAEGESFFEGSSHKTLYEKRRLMELKNVSFVYPNGRQALEGIDFKIGTGEFVAVLGENGAGKTTLLRIMAGLAVPGWGKVDFHCSKEKRAKNPTFSFPGGAAYLSQNPGDYLIRDTVEEELLFTLKNFGMKDDGIVDYLLKKLELDRCRKANPRDLSGGEQQRAALASVLVLRPSLLLLDEPTRGLDRFLKIELGNFLTGLIDQGVSVVMATHDVEFAARFARRAVIIHGGEKVYDGEAREVFSRSLFYATQIGKLCRGFAEGITTVEEALEVFGPVIFDTVPAKGEQKGRE
ncbi:MAG: energy-coupling factor ABC transporter ATP-binding protein [Clostridia bacterium]|nr:energy-coupling factor ABC transporter ATP-binding protein [Clostridia bacterium]